MNVDEPDNDDVDDVGQEMVLALEREMQG